MHISRKFWLMASSLAMLVAPSGRAEAGFLNETVHSSYRFPDFGTVVMDGGNKLVNPTASYSFFSGIVNNLITVSDTQISLGFDGSATKSTGSFNGFEVDTVGIALPIIGVTIDPASSLPGFTSADLTFTSTEINLNVSGLSVTASSRVLVDVTFGPATVPEPASIVLTGLSGLMAWGAARVRRARTALVGDDR